MFLFLAVMIPVIAYFLAQRLYNFDTRNHAEDSGTLEKPGLGQCHWLGGIAWDHSNWGYPSNTAFLFDETTGGDSWAAVEQKKGVFTFASQEKEIAFARNSGKHVWLNVNVADDTNKEHNIPRWALDEGVETFQLSKCDTHLYFGETPWSEVQSVWDNPKYIDQNETILRDKWNKDTTDISKAEKVVYPQKIAAVWDPKFRQLFGNMLKNMRSSLQPAFDDGTVQAVVMFSGGRYGECIFNYQCAGYQEGSCLPDELNPNCPIIQSMAKSIQKLHYPDLTAAEVAPLIARKSNCSASNLEVGKKVELCTEANHENCPRDSSRTYCYVFDDYFIQAMKDLTQRYVNAFSPTPVVFQVGNGLSGTGRVAYILQKWMNEQFKPNQIWLKSNSWGPGGWASLGLDGKSYNGYEPGVPYAFTSEYYAANGGSAAADWCKSNKDQPECASEKLDYDAIARRSIALSIKRGIVDDKSEFLCLQSVFFEQPEHYHFNPSDSSQDCSSSEISVSKYGVGFCPGFLNYAMGRNVKGCKRNCTGKTCGADDGCGGICTNCPTGKTCDTATKTCLSKDETGDGTVEIPGDLNHDQQVTPLDYSLFISDYLDYKNTGIANTRSDFNSDGKISVTDYALFVNAYLDFIES